MLRSIFALSFCGAVLSAPFAACGGVVSNGGGGDGGPTGAGSATGTVSGTSIAVADAIATAARGSPGVDAKYVAIEILDVANACTLAQTFPKNATKANITALLLTLGSFGASAVPIVPGTYSVAPTSFDDGGNAAQIRASGDFYKNDAQCKDLIPNGQSSAKGGTVTISSISTTTVSGSFDLTFLDGALRGSFTAAFCTLPDSGASPRTDGGPSCVQ